MLIRLTIGIYILGCICVVLDMADELNEKSNVGFWFSVIYILSKKESYNIILKSWYYLHLRK